MHISLDGRYVAAVGLTVGLNVVVGLGVGYVLEKVGKAVGKILWDAKEEQSNQEAAKWTSRAFQSLATLVGTVGLYAFLFDGYELLKLHRMPIHVRNEEMGLVVWRMYNAWRMDHLFLAGIMIAFGVTIAARGIWAESYHAHNTDGEKKDHFKKGLKIALPGMFLPIIGYIWGAHAASKP